MSIICESATISTICKSGACGARGVAPLHHSLWSGSRRTSRASLRLCTLLSQVLVERLRADRLGGAFTFRSRRVGGYGGGAFASRLRDLDGWFAWLRTTAVLSKIFSHHQGLSSNCYGWRWWFCFCVGEREANRGTPQPKNGPGARSDIPPKKQQGIGSCLSLIHI